MKEARFKVGDKVRILDGSKIDKYTGTWVTDTMSKYVGKVTKITFIDRYYDGDRIGYNVKGNRFKWDERGLAPVANETIVIYRKDLEVIALDKTTGKKAVAKCHPSDEFNFETGARIAFDRLIAQTEPKFKVGDNVRVKSDLEVGKQYGSLFMCDSKMADTRGFSGKIRTADSADFTYQIEEQPFWYSEEMLESAPKFKVGDRVIGNDKADKKYGITTKGWRGKVTKICEDSNTFSATGDYDEFYCLDPECFDLDTSPVYYNGKVVCVKTTGGFTKGKIYTFVDGKVKDDDDDFRPIGLKKFESFEAVNKFGDWRDSFIEVVE